ncbi:MAG: glycine-rich domain-containing protein-like [Sphingobacteriales bacterium]|nr:glycine-rich domain-containing protein-like [Sphingobacteriales bacterium]
MIERPYLLDLRQVVEITNSGVQISEDAIQEYEKFLCLAKLNPELKAVPSKKIDAVWHFHLNHVELYSKDCINYFGFVLKHKPAKSVEEKEKLKEIYSMTNKLWYNTFNSQLGNEEDMAICGIGGDGDGGDDD